MNYRIIEKAAFGIVGIMKRVTANLRGCESGNCGDVAKPG